MIHYTDDDTIAAIATAQGQGGIGIIRISGPDSANILKRVFYREGRKEQSISRSGPSLRPYRLEHGWVHDLDGITLDEVMAVFMPGPHSFTAEDTVELHCHGGVAVLNAVLDTLFKLGARPAERGEFTRRAYLNGRLDLSQAEAVAEMISAPTREAVFLARNKLEGRLGEELEAMRTTLDWLRSRLYMYIDFPDESDEESQAGGLSDLEFRSRFATLKAQIKELIQAFHRARLWRDGASAVLAGAVNVGKSSLLNSLLGRRRAIVSDMPGTTRDFIEESLDLQGLPLRLVDTAGLRPTSNLVEAEGIDMGRELQRDADLVLLVLDASELIANSGFAFKNEVNKNGHTFDDSAWLALEQAFTDKNHAAGNFLPEESLELLEEYCGTAESGKLIIILNKMDLIPELEAPSRLFGHRCAAVSASSGTGLSELCELLRRVLLERAYAGGPASNFESETAPSLRQKIRLEQVLAELEALDDEFALNIPAELLSVRLDQAARFLRDVSGASGTEDILAQVFSSFCIGK